MNRGSDSHRSARGRDIDIRGKRQGVILERVFEWVCRLAVIVPLCVLAILLIDVVRDGLARVNVDFLLGYQSRTAALAGIWPALIGSLYLIGMTAALAIPLGVGAALYLEEYGRHSRMAGFFEVAIANLAGVPSVIYGLLGLGLFVRACGFGVSVLAGACTLAILVLPTVIMATREALRTIPDSVREAAFGLGATRWQVIRRVVLPMALPGILTGAILAVSRAIGETAPLIVIGAVVYISFVPDALMSEFTALPIQIFRWVSMPQKEFLINAAAGIVVLMVTLLILNSVAIWLRHRHQSRR